jgi:hypothetical protein
MKSLSVCVIVVLGLCVAAATPARARRDVAGEPSFQTFQARSQQAAQSQTAAQRLAGAWQLTTRTVRRSDGTVLADPVLGDRPPGRLFYDASGVMMLQMMRLGRAAAIGTPANPKDSANPRIVLGYDAYFGTFAVDEKAGTITHHVEGSLFPEDLGKDFVRRFVLDGDTLTLSFTSAAEGGDVTRTLVFRRSRAAL